MPVADSEIIFGAYTEYTGLKFAFFLLAEYGGIVALSAIASVLFLGGYLPLPKLEFIPDPLWMLAKIGALSFLIIWLRVTYPRLREDQLQRASWLVLIPLALAADRGGRRLQGRVLGGSWRSTNETSGRLRRRSRGPPASACSRGSGSR